MNNKIDYSKVLSSMRNDKFHLSVKEVNALVKEFPLLETSSSVLVRLVERWQMKSNCSSLDEFRGLVLGAIDDIEKGIPSRLNDRAREFYRDYKDLIDKHGLQIIAISNYEYPDLFIAEIKNNSLEMVSWQRFDERFDEFLR